MHLLPEVSLPVFQVSLPHNFDPRDSYRLGQSIASLRAQGILILCSGSMTHNLGDFRLGAQGDLPYVQKFSEWVKQAIVENRLEDLFNYRQMAPDGVRAHPTEEHFLPLFIALGSRLKEDQLQMMGGDISYGILAMDALLWDSQSYTLSS
jgi:4,5-DOPA dioxygenase extradiol